MYIAMNRFRVTKGDPRRSGPLIIELAITSRFISGTRNSKGSKFARPYYIARPKQRDRHPDLQRRPRRPSATTTMPPHPRY
jgi:hypothetical protein